MKLALSHPWKNWSDTWRGRVISDEYGWRRMYSTHQNPAVGKGYLFSIYHFTFLIFHFPDLLDTQPLESRGREGVQSGPYPVLTTGSQRPRVNSRSKLLEMKNEKWKMINGK